MSAITDLAKEQSRGRRESHRDRGHDGNSMCNGNEADPFVAFPKYPMRTARGLVSRFLTDGEKYLAWYWRGAFWRFEQSKGWREWQEQDVRTWCWRQLEHAEEPADIDRTKPFGPTPQRVSAIIEALKACLALSSDIDPPVWTSAGDEERPPAHEFLRVANGLLHVSRQELWPDDPVHFSFGACPIEYDPEAPRPKEFLQFLKTQWADDPESIRGLQEWFGYALAGASYLQKVLLMVGPTRSGKGVICHILRALVGSSNVCFPKLQQLGERFGLAMFIGKRLAIVTDGRLSHRADKVAVGETLLSISGQDPQSIERKFMSEWHGRVGVCIIICANELPTLVDSSGALSGRFIILQQSKSFLGCEDTDLTDRLLAELPSIFIWALEGLARLRHRGYFEQPKSGSIALETLSELASPIKTFVRDVCDLAPGRQIRKNELYQRYCDWCQAQGFNVPKKPKFAKDLLAAFPGIVTPSRPQTEDDPNVRKHIYTGIDLKPS